MLCDFTEFGKNTSCKYWDDINIDYEISSEIFVKLIKQEEIMDELYIRTFEICDNFKKKIVEQIHYTGWPDHFIPTEDD